MRLVAAVARLKCMKSLGSSRPLRNFGAHTATATWKAHVVLFFANASSIVSLYWGALVAVSPNVSASLCRVGSRASSLVLSNRTSAPPCVQ